MLKTQKTFQPAVKNTAPRLYSEGQKLFWIAFTVY